MEKKHPIQPLVLDKNGTMRFKENAIVNYLLEAGPFYIEQDSWHSLIGSQVLIN